MCSNGWNRVNTQKEIIRTIYSTKNIGTKSAPLHCLEQEFYLSLPNTQCDTQEAATVIFVPNDYPLIVSHGYHVTLLV